MKGIFLLVFCFYIFYFIFCFVFYFKEELGKKGNIWAGALGSHLAISSSSTYH